jgi:hypothetical protein
VVRELSRHSTGIAHPAPSQENSNKKNYLLNGIFVPQMPLFLKKGLAAPQDHK